MSIIAIIGLAFIAAASFAIGSGTNTAAAIATGVFFLSVPALYFAPSFIAHRREHANRTAILVLNIFLGWTMIGWVIALVWAHSTASAPQASGQVPAPGGGGAQGRIEPELHRECPFCAETIKAAAIKCRFCGSAVEPVEVAAPVPPAPPAPVVKALAPGDMACRNCAKHIPIDGVKCPFCGHPNNG